MINPNHYQAIDPMALLLSSQAYYIWTQIHHPHVPSVGEIAKGLASLSEEEKKATLQRAKLLAEYAEAVQNALKVETRTTTGKPVHA